jgi:hypothetical protein
MSNDQAPRSPKYWKYLMGAFIALIILIPLWSIFAMLVIQPDSLMTQEQTMSNRLLWWVAGPLAAVVLLFGGSWIKSTKSAEGQARPVEQVETPAAATGQARRDYVLEIIGLGVTLDKYRQGKLWEALQQGDPYASIREQDKEKYPWSGQEKSGISGGRGGDSLENGARYTPMYWGVPVLNAEPPIADPGQADTREHPIPGLVDGYRSSGMAWHLFTIGPRRFAERPDHILEDVFAFFDAHPDLPYLVLNADDSMDFRNSTRMRGSAELLKDGNYIPEMPDASALFVLARRERVDPLRTFVWDDPDNDFVQNTLRWMYGNLMAAVPHPRRNVLQSPAKVGANPSHEDAAVPEPERQPLVAEWLEAAAAFAQRPDVRGTGLAGVVDGLKPWKHRPPTEWKPTPWFPIPWNRDQLNTFDRLPTLGYLHRPTFVKFADQDGRPLTGREERRKALLAGWEDALRTLPETARTKAPARVVVATGGDTEQTIILHGMLGDYAASGGPDLLAQPGLLIDTDRRLGNTGAATLFMQMGIGVMGSYRAGGVSAALNMRDPNEASIVMISPPSDELRKTQRHIKGGDVFAHRGTPAVAPANYGQ